MPPVIGPVFVLAHASAMDGHRHDVERHSMGVVIPKARALSLKEMRNCQGPSILFQGPSILLRRCP